MKFVTQSRIGKNGTCFRSCIASLLNLKEADVPDFKEANLDPGVDGFLKKYGLSYKEIPAEDDNAPLGLHLALGTSPRGGQHAVVCKDGVLLHDPHPQDGTGRGLTDVKAYGLLLPLKGAANDAAPLKGKRLHTAAEELKTKHDEVMHSPARFGSTMENMYRATNRPVMDLVNEAASLLAKAKLDDDPVYWQGKLATAKKALEQATVNARQGGYERAVQQQEYALSLAHMVIDKMRNTGRAKDSADSLRKEWKKAEQAYLKAKATHQDSRTLSKLFDVEQKARTAYVKERDAEGQLPPYRAKDAGPCLTCGKPTKGSEHFCSRPCEEQWVAKKYPQEWADMKKRVGKLALDSDKRQRLHRALDCVMDRSFGK